MRITKFRLIPNGYVPNNPGRPVLVCHALLPPHSKKKAAIFEGRFHANGWRGVWRDRIYAYCHFHSNAHEVLGIARGRVTIELGGDGGKTVSLRAGDMIILPAGTGHKRLAATRNLMVVGAYPSGQQRYTLCKPTHARKNIRKKIEAVPIPKADPFFGKQGPLVKYWGMASDKK